MNMQAEQMHSISGTLSQAEAQEYLETLESLARELDRAMQAIAARELPLLEDSVSRQRATCARLAELPKRSTARRLKSPETTSAPPDAELNSRIQTAAESLLVLNKSYSALLKHSGETVRLFAGLFRGYAGHTHPGAGAAPKLHTWSCEL
jgi:hypothetical protein